MPKQKTLPPKGKGASEITDPRFADFATDPRFRLPSKKHTRTKIDKRFSRMLTDDDFSRTAKVDRYGRKLSGGGKKKALEKLYVPDDVEDSDSDEDEDKDGASVDDEKAAHPGRAARRKNLDRDTSEDEEGLEVEDDEVVERELKRANGYDPARGGGFSSSSEDDSEDDDEEEEEIEEAEFPNAQAQGVELGDVSSRIAVVNLDWDNIRAIDLMAVFQSFVKPGGKIHKISIYQSEFGKERMEREELEGPPKEIFARKEGNLEEDDSEDSEDSDGEDDEEEDEKIKKELQKEDDGQEFDGAALRQYQLERLRYYYAVIICSDNDTAQHIYESTDGTEYLSSANFFDLRFIPDGTEFDERPRDECTTVPAGYRPTEFVTDALQHSKVKLTWDANPEEASRKDAIKRAFSGSRAEIGENDLRAYLGSDSESEAEEEEVVEANEEAPKLSKKELARQKMRAALGLSEEPTKSSKKEAGPVGDMEITFSAGLTAKEKEGGVFENKPIIEETTAERYIRKEKERKARRREKAKAIREGRDPNAEPQAEQEDGEEGEASKDLGFDDPFFQKTDGEAASTSKKSSLRKEERLRKREAKQAEAAEKATQRAELELLMQDDHDNDTGATPSTHLEHFDINEIARVEKALKKNKKKLHRNQTAEEASKRGGLQEGFEIDVHDPRFSKVHESHEYAIDSSHPRFQGTQGMKKLLEEGRKRRRGAEDTDELVAAGGEKEKNKKKRKDRSGGEEEGEEVGNDGAELRSLVEMVKKKSKRSSG